MVQDRERRDTPGYVPKHQTRLVLDKFWLSDVGPADVIAHPHLTKEDLLRENRLSWDAFYSIATLLRRTRSGIPTRWTTAAKLTYIIFSLMFRRVYGGNGLVADVVHKKRIGTFTKAAVKVGVWFYRRATGVGMTIRTTPRVAGRT